MITMIQEEWEVALLALTLYREARGESVQTKRMVAWSIRNRAMHPGWWGTGWSGVITMHDQYSSMSHGGDPNLVKWPAANESVWMACMDVASEVYNNLGSVDISLGSTHYFDKSLDGGREPAWSRDGSMVHVVDAGNFHFWKRA